MPRILAIEDEKDIQEVLAYNLRLAGYEMVSAYTGRDGLSLARSHAPSLVLLDVMLPDMSGFEVCRAMRGEAATRDVPVIVLTARAEEIDRVVGFEVGADDYVVKPFSVRELVLRVGAVLRRRHSAPEQVSSFGCLRIDRGAHRTFIDESEVELTALEFKLLLSLFDRRDRVQSRTTLLDEVWGITSDVTTRTVDTHVKRLREKLGQAGAYVETVRGVGYRFAAAPREGEACAWRGSPAPVPERGWSRDSGCSST